MAKTINRDVDIVVLRHKLAVYQDRPNFVYGYPRSFWDCSNGCDKPLRLVLHGRSSTDYQSLEMYIPCRKCEVCLARRAYKWRCRAEIESRVASRIWLVTLTLNPDEHCKIQYAIKGYDDMPEHVQFRERCRIISKEITKYLKRVRKNSGSRFRYLLVAEAHKSGLPHFHLLMYERHLEMPISKRVIQSAWPFGYTNAKLVDIDASRYVCKYLGKDMMSRVRASVRFGQPSDEVLRTAFALAPLCGA